MQQRRPRRRWSILTCLEHGERFFGAHTATLHLEESTLHILGAREMVVPGRLMVASSSITFEPDDADSPLVRITLRDIPQPILEWAGTPPAKPGFELQPRSVAVRMEKFAPLRTVRPPSSPFAPLRISLDAPTARPAEVLRLLNTLLEISRKTHTQQGGPLQQLFEQSELHTQPGASFDQASLVDPLEAQLLHVRVQRVRPMLTLPATLLLTESRLYVSDPSGSDASLTHWPLGALERVLRRRHLLRPTGVELQFRRGSGAEPGGRAVGSTAADAAASTRLSPDDPETLLVSLSSQAAREQLFLAIERAAGALRGAPLPPPPEHRLREQTERWRHGLIDNFT